MNVRFDYLVIIIIIIIFNVIKILQQKEKRNLNDLMTNCLKLTTTILLYENQMQYI